MRKVDFEILEPSQRLHELKQNKDDDLVKFTLQRVTGLEYESFNNLKIEYSFVRHRIFFRDKPEILIRIMDDLERLKVSPIIKNNSELMYDIDVLFQKIS